MSFTVPTAKRTEKQVQKEILIPAAGTYPAKIAAVRPEQPDGAVVDWKFRAPGVTKTDPTPTAPKQWTLEHLVSGAELGDILVDLGLAGQTVELADIVGLSARIQTRTFGGRSSAGVQDVLPAE